MHIFKLQISETVGVTSDLRNDSKERESSEVLDVSTKEIHAQ